MARHSASKRITAHHSASQRITAHHSLQHRVQSFKIAELVVCTGLIFIVFKRVHGAPCPALRVLKLSSASASVLTALLQWSQS